MKLSPEITQKIFIGWFALLTLIAIFNFYHNITDAKTQGILETRYAENADRYDESIKEHEGFRADINYLKGRVACSQPQ